MYEVLIDNMPLAEARKQVEDRLWIASADINLAAAEVELAGVDLRARGQAQWDPFVPPAARSAAATGERVTELLTHPRRPRPRHRSRSVTRSVNGSVTREIHIPSHPREGRRQQRPRGLARSGSRRPAPTGTTGTAPSARTGVGQLLGRVDDLGVQQLQLEHLRGRGRSWRARPRVRAQGGELSDELVREAGQLCGITRQVGLARTWTMRVESELVSWPSKVLPMTSSARCAMSFFISRSPDISCSALRSAQVTMVGT